MQPTKRAKVETKDGLALAPLSAEQFLARFHASMVSCPANF
jgi:hypothetical protein